MIFPIGSYVRVTKVCGRYDKSGNMRMKAAGQRVGIVKSKRQRAIDHCPGIVAKHPAFAWSDMIRVSFPEEKRIGWIACELLEPIDMPMMTSNAGEVDDIARAKSRR